MKIGVIGFGNLGKAFVSGLLKSGFDSKNICLTAKTEKTLSAARENYPTISVFSKKADLVEFADVLILCVEPNHMLDVCVELSNLNVKDKIVISFASKVSKITIEEYLGVAKNNNIIFRAMPNIAIKLCEGIIGISIDEVDRVDKKTSEVFSILEKLGKLIFVEDEELEKITVAASCGLAFANMLILSYQSNVEKIIGSKEMAKEITHQVFLGTIKVLEDNGLSNEDFNSLITTKGGATEKGLAVFDLENINSVLRTVINKSYEHASKR